MSRCITIWRCVVDSMGVLCLFCCLGLTGMANVAWSQDLAPFVEAASPGVMVLMAEDSQSGRSQQGSAFVVDTAGWVLATAHQVADADRIAGHFEDGRRVRLELYASDASHDLALLKADEALPTALRLGDARTLRAGAPLWSIAAPRELAYTVSRGIVSHRDRRYRGFSVIQTDLDAAPGSSGAPVFDSEGAVVGMILMHLEDERWVTFVNPIHHAWPLLEAAGLREMEDASLPALPTELLTPAPALSDREARAVAAYNRGVLAESFEEKRDAYRLAHALLPAFYEALFNLAVVYERLAAWDEAEAAYGQAGQLRPDAPEIYRNRGRLYLQMDEFEAALDDFLRVQALKPDAPQSYNDLGEAYRRLGALTEAVAAFEQALERAPDYAEAHYNLGLVHVEQNGLPAARRHFERFLELRPDSPQAATVRGWVAALE